MAVARQIFWLDLTRFDVKTDKSTWLEMGDVLSRLNYAVNLITSYANGPFTSDTHAVNFINIRPTRLPGLFRIALLVKAMLILIKKRDRQAIYILPAGALFIAPVMKVFGLKNVHLDVRTIPVTVHGVKKQIDTLIYWKIALRFFSRFVNSSSFITEALQKDVERTAKTPFPRSCLWSSGVNTSLFELAKMQPDSSGVFEFFYHGTITVDRGVLTMVEALGDLPAGVLDKVKLTVVGAGPGAKNLADLIVRNRLQTKVNYVGFVDYKNIADYVRSASCCICPLPDRREWRLSSPLKVLEYMAAAKPIIATPILAHEDVLKGLPFVVWTDGYDRKSIADAMVNAFHNRSGLSDNAASGPEFVRENFDWEIIGKRFADHLSRCYG